MLVWLDLDQAGLDRAYDQAVWAANRNLVNARRDQAGAAARQRLNPTRHQYGSTAYEAFDYFTCGRARAPVMIFVHGGAWRAGEAWMCAHLAEPFIASGVNVAILDFIDVVAAGGDLMTMVRQVRAGIAWIVKNAGRLECDSDRVYVSGHSSGAHLASCAVITDWRAEYGVSDDVVKGAVLISGMYDLEPVRRSARSSYVRFDDDVVERLSAVRHLDKIRCPLILAYGGEESPEFQRQTRHFDEALRADGRDAVTIKCDYFNHFEMLETLHNPYGPVGQVAIAMTAKS